METNKIILEMKKPTRSIKELLKVMSDNRALFSSGLCHWNRDLCFSGIITDIEHEILRKYIAANRPSKYSSLDAYVNSNNGYYWKKYNIKPRLKWIEKHIKLNSIN